MRKHFPVVRGHVAVQIDTKVNETGAFSSQFSLALRSVEKWPVFFTTTRSFQDECVFF